MSKSGKEYILCVLFAGLAERIWIRDDEDCGMDNYVVMLWSRWCWSYGVGAV